MGNRKSYIILETYTGYRDGFYPENTAPSCLEGARKMFPRGNFILAETDEDELNDKRYGDIPSEEFKAMIEQARREKNEA